jgi:predicted CoA-binding protein
MQNPADSEIKKILDSAKNIAIIGLSDSPEKPSYGVARYLISSGYNIFPVNPKYDSILGAKCYKSLNDIDEKIDIVDVFRRPEHILPVAEKAIEIEARVLWMQLGIINEEAAKLANEAGLDVIMDRCIKVDHRRLSL